MYKCNYKYFQRSPYPLMVKEISDTTPITFTPR